MRSASIKFLRSSSILACLLFAGAVSAQEGTRPNALRRRTFAAADAFLFHRTEHLERIAQGKQMAIRLERKSDAEPAADDLIIDFEHESLFRNPSQQSLLIKSGLDRVAIADMSGKAGQFNLPAHRLQMRLPPYLNLSGNTLTREAGDFTFSCELKPAAASGEILRRENFSGGRQYLFSVSLRNSRIVVRLENLLQARQAENTVLESLQLSSVDKIRPGQRNFLLLTYHEGEGRFALYLNGREQVVKILKRAADESYALTFENLKAAPLTLFSPYRGYADNVVFSNRVLGDEDLRHYGALKPYGDRYDQRRGLLLSDVFDMGYSQSSITALTAVTETSQENALAVEYRCHDLRFGAGESAAALPFTAINRAKGKKCRFVQFRALFTANNAGTSSPALRSVAIEYRENPPPERPATPRILSARDETLEIEIAPNSELDVVSGGRYIIYYGHAKHKPEGAIFFRSAGFSGGTVSGEPIAHRAPVRVKITNDTIAQNKKYADVNPRFRNRYPVFEKGVGFYFWVTACDNAYTEAQERADHESLPSVPVFARFE